MSAHLFTENLQPATNWVDRCGGHEHRDGWKPGVLLRPLCCGKRRRASACGVQVFYDGIRIWCAAGKGCKDPREIERKRRAAFKRRSEGQRRRWGKA
jgi:hypothetical protein